MRGRNPREAASRLGVQYVVDGRVHREGDSLRIRVQLSGPDGFVLWTDSYDRPAREVFSTWDEIAVAVRRALPVELGGDPLRRRQGDTEDLAAYDNFVKGRHAWFKRTPGGLLQAFPDPADVFRDIAAGSQLDGRDRQRPRRDAGCLLLLATGNA